MTTDRVISSVNNLDKGLQWTSEVWLPTEHTLWHISRYSRSTGGRVCKNENYCHRHEPNFKRQESWRQRVVSFWKAARHKVVRHRSAPIWSGSPIMVWGLPQITTIFMISTLFLCVAFMKQREGLYRGGQKLDCCPSFRTNSARASEDRLEFCKRSTSANKVCLRSCQASVRVDTAETRSPFFRLDPFHKEIGRFSVEKEAFISPIRENYGMCQGPNPGAWTDGNTL